MVYRQTILKIDILIDNCSEIQFNRLGKKYVWNVLYLRKTNGHIKSV